MKITIFGGDERLRVAQNELRNMGYTADSIGLYKDQVGDYKDAQVFLLPVPTTRDGKTVWAPLTDCEIPLDEVERSARPDTLILCAGHTFQTARQVDYCQSDAYALKNAVPTAEGAIRIAIERTPFTLWEANALVIGYGRVGKVLAERLSAMKCHVTVAARKNADKALARVLGYGIADSTKLSGLQDFDLIFNTVDVPLLESAANTLSERCVIDLSSKGGLSPQTAKEYRIDYCKAPGLPGKVSPLTAGKILAQTVHEILQNQ